MATFLTPLVRCFSLTIAALAMAAAMPAAQAGGLASTASALAATTSTTSSAATGWYRGWGYGGIGYRGYGWGYNHPYHRTPYLNFAYSRAGWGNTYGYGPYYSYYGYGFNGRAPYAWGWPYRYSYGGWGSAMYGRPYGTYIGSYSPGYYGYQGLNGYSYTASRAFYGVPVGGAALIPANTFSGDYAPYVYYGQSQYAQPALAGIGTIDCCN